MLTKQLLVSGVVALAAAGAHADDITIVRTPESSSLSREQVKAELARARSNHELLATGEVGQRFNDPTGPGQARADVRRQVLAARASHELLVAGESDPRAAADMASPSTRSRGDVKAEVLAARQAGELMPAGEGADAPGAHGASVPNKHPFRTLASKVRGER
jgi:hypothetical protein